MVYPTTPMTSVEECLEMVAGLTLPEAACYVVEALAARFGTRKDTVSYVLLLRLGRDGRSEITHKDLAETWFGMQETLAKAVREKAPRTYASIASNPLYFD